MLDPDAELAKGLESGMNVEVELAHVTLSNIQECIAVIIPSFSDVRVDYSLEICNEGNLSSFTYLQNCTIETDIIILRRSSVGSD